MNQHNQQMEKIYPHPSKQSSHLFEFTELYIGLNNFQLRKEKPNKNMHIILYQTRLYGTYILKKTL